MPYIPDGNRRFADGAVYAIMQVLRVLKCRGTMNYILFKVAKHTCKTYSEYADFRSELMEAHTEIGRRLLAPYEDIKIEENGDVE